VKCIYTLITLYEIDVNRSIFDEAMREKMIFLHVSSGLDL